MRNMERLKCSMCGLEKTRLSSPERICDQCLEKKDIEIIDTVSIPNDIIFVSKLAKMGDNPPRRIIEIPKKQRPFLEDDTEYIIIIKKKAE